MGVMQISKGRLTQSGKKSIDDLIAGEMTDLVAETLKALEPNLSQTLHALQRAFEAEGPEGFAEIEKEVRRLADFTPGPIRDLMEARLETRASLSVAEVFSKAGLHAEEFHSFARKALGIPYENWRAGRFLTGSGSDFESEEP